MSSWTALTLADHEDRGDIFGCAYQKADTFGILGCVGEDVRRKREEWKLESANWVRREQRGLMNDKAGKLQ